MSPTMILAASIAVLLLTALSGCSTTMHYRNSANPAWGQVEFDRDWYACRRENMRPRSVHYGSQYGTYSDATLEVDEAMARSCMAARGWTRADPAERVVGCPGTMHWSATKGFCVRKGED